MGVQNNPLVSIVVPVYNLEQYVEAFVRSLKTQTYNNIEIVIVNDGSKDSSLDKIDQFTHDDPRFIVVSTKNQGESLARKTGIELANGQYITFLDADDILMPEAVERMVDAIKDGYDIVCCRLQRICSSYSSTVREGYTEDMFGFEFIEAIVMHRISVNMCAKLYRRELLDNISYHPLKLGVDSLFNMQVGCLLPKVKCIAYVGYGYLQRAGSSNHSHFDYDYLKQFSDAVEQELLKHDDKLEGRAEFLSLLNKLRWYRVYTSKSRNKWIGDSEFVADINRLVDRYKADLKRYDLAGTLWHLSLYRYLPMLPLLKIGSTVVRWNNSLKRRLAR